MNNNYNVFLISSIILIILIILIFKSYKHSYISYSDENDDDIIYAPPININKPYNTKKILNNNNKLSNNNNLYNDNKYIDNIGFINETIQYRTLSSCSSSLDKFFNIDNNIKKNDDVNYARGYNLPKKTNPNNCNIANAPMKYILQ